MTTLGIEYLTGHVVARDRSASDAPEFPPHFGRVFMAMAATYFETRGDEKERAALEWLEASGPPRIEAAEKNPRSLVTAYVPVNDDGLGADALPALRRRQSRTFGVARLNHPFVYLQWDAMVPEELRDPLERLCRKVTRIGHSSSLVQMWVAAEHKPVGDVWHPEAIGEMRMRVTEPGTLAYLERAFNEPAILEYGELVDALETAKGKRRKEIKEQLNRFPKNGPKPDRPWLTNWQGYSKNTTRIEAVSPIDGPFDCRPIVFKPQGEQCMMGMEATLQLTSALRDAAMKAVGENVPEWLSGHRPDGRPSLLPHAAFFPMPFVGAKYADGHVMGLAMALPRGLEAQDETGEESLRRVIGSLLYHEDGEEKEIRLWRTKDGKNIWEWKLEREKSDQPLFTLRSATWTGPAIEWASVTPVVLHHYPKRNRTDDVERIVYEAFASAGLPRPVELCVQPVSLFEGALPARAMPEFSEGGEKMCRYQTHVVVRFASPVRGPVLIGRGRFRGYGLMRPVGVKRG
jgi:CRISPR-associated protein Csb2